MAATNSPRSYSGNPALLRSLLLETPGCLVAAFGDSTWSGIGGPGNYDMAWMQYLWANRFGGVSGTELSYPDQTRATAGSGPVSDSFVMSDYNGTYFVPTGVSKANPGVVTVPAGHGVTTGGYVKCVGETGFTGAPLNGNTYKANNVTATTFELQTTGGANVNTSGYGGAFVGNGVWYKVAQLADSYLLPHRNVATGNGYVFPYSPFDGWGHFLLLNHAHDNQTSASGGPFGSYYGYNQVPAWMYDQNPSLGSAAFANGTMYHGRSLIDASSNGSTSKLKLEMFAACYPGSIDKLRYRILTQTAGEFYAKNIATPIEIVGPTLTAGGAVTLNTTAGTYRKFTSSNLPLLGESKAYYMAEVAGNTNGSADAAQILGTRFISDTLFGPIIDNFSQAGYATGQYSGPTYSVKDNHANSFGFYTTVGYKVAFICYGHNDDGGGASKATYKANLSSLCTLLFAAGIQAIVLVSTSAKIAETAVKATYADAEYELALADSRISTVNVREITQTDSGWSPTNTAKWTSDGLHHNATGAEVFQTAFFNELMSLMDGVSREHSITGDDTYIQLDVETNHGADTPIPWLSAATIRPILRFSLSEVAPGEQVTAARIRLWPASADGFPGFNNFNNILFKVEYALTDDPTDAATWLTLDGSTSWNTAGGGATDFNLQAAVQQVLMQDEDEPFAYAVTGLASMMNAAKAAGFTHIIFRLRWLVEGSGTNTAFYFASDNANNQDLVPLLIFTVSGTPPGGFSNISPTNAATGQTTCDVTLDWSDSAGADSYNVYFGTSNPPPLAATGVLASQWTSPLLVAGTTYYWYVVAVNSDGTTTGDQWSFTTNAAIAAVGTPTPANAATGVAVNTTFNFVDGPNAFTPRFDLYLWADGDAIPTTATIEDFTPNTALSAYSYGPLQYATVYNWKIVSVYECQSIDSTTWTFTTLNLPGGFPGVPTLPDPGAEGVCETDIPIGTTQLSCTLGALTNSVVVFFSTLPDPTQSPLGQFYLGEDNAGAFTCPTLLPTLEYGVTYYWQVWEYAGASQTGNLTVGPIWCFTTEADPSPPPVGATSARFRNRIRPFKRDLTGFGQSGDLSAQ